MRKLVPIKRLIEESDEDGSVLFVDEDDVVELDPDELEELAENPDEAGD